MRMDTSSTSTSSSSSSHSRPIVVHQQHANATDRHALSYANVSVSRVVATRVVCERVIGGRTALQRTYVGNAAAAAAHTYPTYTQTAHANRPPSRSSGSARLLHVEAQRAAGCVVLWPAYSYTKEAQYERAGLGWILTTLQRMPSSYFFSATAERPLRPSSSLLAKIPLSALYAGSRRGNYHPRSRVSAEQHKCSPAQRGAFGPCKNPHAGGSDSLMICTVRALRCAAGRAWVAADRAGVERGCSPLFVLYLEWSRVL